MAIERIAELRTAANSIAQDEFENAERLINDKEAAAHHLHIETLEFVTLFEALSDFNGLNEDTAFFLERATRAFIKQNPTGAEEAFDCYANLARLLRIIAFARAFIEKKHLFFDILANETEVFEDLKADEIAAA